ncbi:MAG: hypothetical protein AB7O66_17880 [Limisphaerales bacterium]
MPGSAAGLPTLAPSGQPSARVEPLLIISGMFPPMRGGLPDHTDRLAHELSKTWRVTVLTSTGVATDRPYAVRAEVADWHDRADLERRARQAAVDGPVLWQYVPHMYGRGGVNFAIPRVLGNLAREGRRQVVLAHEIRAPFSWWPHRSVYALAHRLMWRRVLAAADAIGVSTGAWLDRMNESLGGEGERGALASAGGRPDLFLAASPSNIRLSATDAGHRASWRLALGLGEADVVVGCFGSVGMSRQFEWVLDGWREARRSRPTTALVKIGEGPAPRLSQEEARWFRGLGYLGGDEVSKSLQAMDLLALPFEDGVSERRSTFMVGLAHGLAVATTQGWGTGRELWRGSGDFYIGTPVEAGSKELAKALAAAVVDEAGRREIEVRARRRYEARYGWNVLIDAIDHHLI